MAKLPIDEASADPFGMGTEATETAGAFVRKNLAELRAICASLRDAAMLASAHAPERMREFAGAAGFAEGYILGSEGDDDSEFDEFDDDEH